MPEKEQAMALSCSRLLCSELQTRYLTSDGQGGDGRGAVLPAGRQGQKASVGELFYGFSNVLIVCDYQIYCVTQSLN